MPYKGCSVADDIYRTATESRVSATIAMWKHLPKRWRLCLEWAAGKRCGVAANSGGRQAGRARIIIDYRSGLTYRTKFMQDEYHTYYEIGFDFKTSITKDQAVLAMLGWQFKPFYEISEKEFENQYRVHRGEIDDPEVEEPSLLEILYQIKSEADSAYIEAKHENPEDEDIKKQEIKKSHLLIETAYRFYCHIDDELAKGERSKLHIDQNTSKKSGEPYITIMSLAKWTSKEYKIELFPAIESTTFNDLNLSQEEIEDSLVGELTKSGAEQFHITHALLVEAFASKVPNCMHANKKVNYSQLLETLYESTNMTEYLGQGQSTLSKLYPKILEIKNGINKEKLESLKGTKLRNQRISLAFLVEELTKLDNPEADATLIDDDTVSKVAEKLVGPDKGLPGQSQNLINSRINAALSVKNDPNSKQV